MSQNVAVVRRLGRMGEMRKSPWSGVQVWSDFNWCGTSLCLRPWRRVGEVGGGKFDGEVLVCSAGRFGGTGVPKAEKGVLYYRHPPILLDGGYTDAYALDYETSDVLSPPLPNNNNDKDNNTGRR